MSTRHFSSLFKMFKALIKVVRSKPVHRVWLTQIRSMRVASLLSDHGGIPTIDHLMSVSRAAQIMADKHVDALPVLKDNKVYI